MPGPSARTPAPLEPDPFGPVRTCVGCRSRGPRHTLLRVVADASGSALVVDPAARMPGRGAWVHPDPHCLELAVRRRAFGRALRLGAPPDASAVERHLSEAAQHDDAGVDAPEPGSPR